MTAHCDEIFFFLLYSTIYCVHSFIRSPELASFPIRISLNGKSLVCACVSVCIFPFNQN